ncbi:MAG: hypothetical protein MJY82_03840 [Fibrobacter sp.]|nr:hypothetical protein [Fibrobacter sp.]
MSKKINGALFGAICLAASAVGAELPNRPESSLREPLDFVCYGSGGEEHAITITGAAEGTKYSVFDAHGKVIATRFVDGSTIEVEVPHSGSYIVLMGKRTARVDVS